MAAALNDVVKIVVNQRQNSQLVQNVYWYQVVTLTGLEGPYLEVVRDWFYDEIIPVLRVSLSVALSFESIYIINVTNGVDFLEEAIPGAVTGAVTGDALPPNSTFTIRLIRETLATRNGYKRFAGVPESLQSNGVYVGPITDFDALCDILAADIQPAPSIVPLLAPVIVRRGLTGDITAVNNVGSADYRGIGTQNTRKIGRGV